jgi:hypothetical protein
METKQLYEAPEVEVVELRPEGIICESKQYTLPGYGNAEEI